MNLEQYLVTKDMSILDVMKKIENNTKQIVFVVQGKHLLASITDGDIRRHLLAYGNINDTVENIGNHSPEYIKQDKREKALEIIKEKQIAALPIIDDSDELIDIIFRDHLDINKYDNLGIPIVIMAGGKGIRLKPYTDILPKPLIPIGDLTITEHIIKHFQVYNCFPIYMIVNYKKNFIKAYFSERELDYQIQFVEEEEFLGTGGGLSLLPKEELGNTFFLSNCDILVEADYADISNYHKKNKNIITMVCAKKTVTVPYGTVSIGEMGMVTRLEEKPQFSYYTNTGMYILESEVINYIPEGSFTHITDIIQTCIDNGKKVGTYLIDEENWMDMGQIEELEKMRSKMGL